MIGWEELLRRLRHNDFLVSRTTRAGGPGEGGPTTLGVLDAPRRHSSLRRLRRPRLTPGSARYGTDHMQPRSDVASECVFSVVFQPGHIVVPNSAPNDLATGFGRMRVTGTEDQQKVTLDLGRAGKRGCVRFSSQLAVMQARGVPARSGPYARIEGRAKGDMSTSAVTSRTKWSTARTLLEPVEGSGGVGIEVAYGCCLRIALTSGFALIVEFEDGSRWFDPVVDLGRCNQKAVACQANTPAQGRLGELEDVGIENDRGMRTGAARRSDESPHRQIPDRNVDVLLRDHCHEWNRCMSGWLASGQPEFHPPIRTGNALDQAMGLQSVGKTCHVGGIAGQVLGQTAHRGRLFKPQHGAGLQRSQAELAGNLSEVSLGTLGHRKSAWTAGIAIGIKLIVLGVGRVAGADMSVQPPARLRQ